MSGDKDNETPDVPKLLDTLRPPAGTDAYTAETVVRQAPPELIAAARAARREQLGRNLQPATAPAAPGAPVADEADGPLPAIDDGAESADGDNVETRLWQGSRDQTGDASTRTELE